MNERRETDERERWWGWTDAPTRFPTPRAVTNRPHSSTDSPSTPLHRRDEASARIFRRRMRAALSTVGARRNGTASAEIIFAKEGATSPLLLPLEQLRPSGPLPEEAVVRLALARVPVASLSPHR